MIKEIVAGLVAPVASVLNKRTERKIVKDSIKGKAVMSQLDNELQVTLTDAEWERVKASNEGTSWKDEWITLVFTAPVVLILVGSVVAGFGFGSEMVDGAVAGITTLNETGIPMGKLMTATVFAGLGLKIWRS